MNTPRRDNFDDLPILAELRERLERRFAEPRRGNGPRALRRSVASAFRQVPVLVAALVAVAVAVVALTVGVHGNSSATHGPVGPGVGHASQALVYIRDAVRRARQTTKCRARAIPTVSHGSPSAALLSVLGVLRRPGAPSDRMSRYLRVNGPRGVYVGHVRLAREEAGVSYYIVPVSAIARPPGLWTGCYAAIRSTFQAELPDIPARLREPTKARLDQMIALQRRIAAEDAGEGVCLLFAGAASSGGTCGASASEIRQRGLISSYGWVSGVVPNGVATVTVTYPLGSGNGSRSATSNVIGNVFAVPVGLSQLPTQTPAMVWRSADGTIVKTLPSSSGGDDTSAFCTSQIRSACL